MNRHADFLLQLVDSLNTRYAWEHSVRFCRHALLVNRFLVTLPKKTIAQQPDDTILSLCRRLSMPEAFVDLARSSLPAVKFVHFGFEENESTSLYKVYLEFDGTNAVPGAPFLLHHAFKWVVADPSRRFVSQYHWHPGVSAPAIVARLAEIYRSACPESFELARDVVTRAASRPGHRMAYLEVSEPNTERRSFDLNVYDALFDVQDFEPLLVRMSDHFGVPPQQFTGLYERIKTKRFGHLAGGIHRGGQDFFNLYYGVEWRQGKTRAGFGDGEGGAPGQLSSTVDTRCPVRPEISGATMNTAARRELTTEQDQYFNYCSWPYMPVAPTANKFRPVSLLFQSFELAGLDERAFELVERIRAAIGLFRTVWGVKWFGDRLGWEFYFYDYQRRQREVSITRVLDAIKPIVRCDVRANESLGYFMFSLDVNNDLVCGNKDLDVVHMYIGNPGSRVSSGIAYGVTAHATTLENFYFFFDARRDLRQAAEKVLSSAHVDADQIAIDRILRPELRDCNTICIANKQRNDTAYFSGVNVDQLLFFLKMLNYPEAIVGFVEENRDKLDHLLYDVGFDYVANGNELTILKSGYYGVF